MAKNKKPAVYLDTSFFSALCYSGKDIACIHRQNASEDWWNQESANFELVTSRLTEDELARGSYRDQAEACATARRLPYLVRTREVVECGVHLMVASMIPASKPADALHLAHAVLHKIAYVMSWDFAHLANPEVQIRLLRLNSKRGYSTPVLVTPDSIPKKSLGQDLWPAKS